MPLEQGMSFLNVGSGTGYFSSIIAEAIGEHLTNHGIDIWPETLEHAYDCCRRLGKTSIQFSYGNVYELDISRSMRYDRIYLGACANPRSKYLYRLLEVGGVLVGPFQVGRSQQLRKVVRETETEFKVQVLESVRFATLVEPVVHSAPMPSSISGSEEADFERSSEASNVSSSRRSSMQFGEIGLPDVPFTFALHERPWAIDRSKIYPSSFRLMVATLLRSHVFGLPTEMWTQHIFPWCPKRWFEAPRNEQGEPRSVARLPLDLSPLPARKVSDDVEAASDDGGSTMAPSSSEASASSPASLTSRSTSLVLEAVLVEVFNNGQRHAIGTEDDPDDVVEFDLVEGGHFPVYQFLVQTSQAPEDSEASDLETEEGVFIETVAEAAVMV
jgi:hypothetical protein